MQLSDKVVTILIAQAELCSTTSSLASRQQPSYCKIKICAKKQLCSTECPSVRLEGLNTNTERITNV